MDNLAIKTNYFAYLEKNLKRADSSKDNHEENLEN